MGTRILQITDLHVVPEAMGDFCGVDPLASLRGVLEDGMAKDPDLIIVTGDLVECGDAESYSRVGEILRSTSLPVFVLPGNHDSPEHISRDLCGGNIHFRDVHDIDEWRLIFLDSHVDGKGYGELSEDQKSRLGAALGGAGDRYVLVALHHTPIAPCPSFNCQLVGAREFLDGLSSYSNVRAVISGHAHVECKARFHGIEVMTTPATSIQCVHEPAPSCKDLVGFEEAHTLDATRHGYRILDLEPDGILNTEVHWIPSCVVEAAGAKGEPCR